MTTGEAADRLKQLAGRDAWNAAPTPLVLVVAHPDDESVSAGALMAHLPGEVAILHVTDGAPRNGADARAAGCASVEAYAAVRSRELDEALHLLNVDPARCDRLGVPDQEPPLHLTEIARWLTARLRQLSPALVLTHPYEGGHPDHDSCAFAVQQATRAIARQTGAAPLRVEFGSYHAQGDGEIFMDHLPAHTPPGPVTTSLTADEQRLKARLVACFPTQARTLARFPLDREVYRAAPEYDFLLAPHDGTLMYERFPWGMTGERWRDLARTALAAPRDARAALRR